MLKDRFSQSVDSFSHYSKSKSNSNNNINNDNIIVILILLLCGQNFKKTLTMNAVNDK